VIRKKIGETEVKMCDVYTLMGIEDVLKKLTRWMTQSKKIKEKNL